MLTSHGNLVYGSWLPDAACTLYEATFGRWVFHQADRITVATPSEKARIIREDGIPEGKISVIPVGIDLRYWRSFASKARLPAGLAHVDPQTKVILVATQTDPEKGDRILDPGDPGNPSSDSPIFGLFWREAATPKGN